MTFHCDFPTKSYVWFPKWNLANNFSRTNLNWFWEVWKKNSFSLLFLICKLLKVCIEATAVSVIRLINFARTKTPKTKTTWWFLRHRNPSSSLKHKPQTSKLKSDTTKHYKQVCAVLFPKVTWHCVPLPTMNNTFRAKFQCFWYSYLNISFEELI